MLVSYHNHTAWSDGKPTVSELIDAADEVGLDELGISDHLVVHPSKTIEWSMPIDQFSDYFADLSSFRNEGSVKLRVGVEADYFPETIDRLREMLAREGLDFVIGSVHFVDGFPIDESAELWRQLSQDEVDNVWRGYWTRIAELAKSRVFDFVGHPDLPKKFGFRPTQDLSGHIDAAMTEIARAEMAIEINTAGWHKPVSEAYPTLEILKMARKRSIPLLVNADAHETAHLTRDFGRGFELARNAGFSELVRYETRLASAYSF